MKARLVSMGNSRGMRIPKPLIEELGLGDEVELQVRDGAIVIAPLVAPCHRWAEAAATLSEGMLDSQRPARFDEAEWQW